MPTPITFFTIGFYYLDFTERIVIDNQRILSLLKTINLEKYKFLKHMVKNVIGVGIIKKKLLVESKIQDYAKDVQILLILNLLKSSFLDLKRKLSFDFLL